MAAFDHDAFGRWLRESRGVKDEHVFAYRQGAERILEIAGDATLRAAHVEEAIHREMDRGATPKAVANLRKIGDAVLAFARQRPIAPVPAPLPAADAPSPRRSLGTMALPLVAVAVAMAVVGVAALALSRRKPSAPERGFATLTLRSGLKCRVDAIDFEYSYSWKTTAVVGLATLNTERLRSDTLHVLHGGTTVSLRGGDLRAIRYFATDEARPNDVTEVEIEDRHGQRYAFRASNGRVLSGDGTRIWTEGKVDRWRTPDVTLHFKAPGCRVPSVELSAVTHFPSTFPVRVEVH